MTFNNQLWARLIDLHSLDTYPALPCPYCAQQKLVIDRSSLSFRDLTWFANDKTLRRSLEAKHQEVSEVFKESEFLGFLFGVGALVDLMKYTAAKFSGFLECDECGESVAVAGTAMLPRINGQKPASPKVKAEYFSPPVPMFNIHRATPEPIVAEVLQAFQHFHCDLAASGAKIRRAMEKVCEALGYKKRRLHESIEALSQEYPQEAKWLRTLKLVGNEASHADRVAEEDLLASFQVLEAVLDVFRRKALAEEIARSLPAIESKFKRLEIK